MSTPHRTALSAVTALAAFGAVLALAGPAAAHAGVTASDPRALAKNVTVTFTSEAESDSAGIAGLQVVLPTGISPGAVSLKKAPKGWTFAHAQGGYLIGGKPLDVGEDAVYSITVRQLPDARKLVFKTVETYGDGKISRWIEEPKGGAEPENPAPVLTLKAAAKGASLEPLDPSPAADKSADKPADKTAGKTPAASSGSSAPSQPSTGAAPSPSGSSEPSSSPEPSGQREDAADEDDGGVDTSLIVLVVAIAAGVPLFWMIKRRSDSAP
ncbi:DUF1775 domain-containing protein [Streptomyces jumonjinensis]|uniref:DUF1775 domain-containing protein n=1 Tax=Streptomyces jumonjinensis TaxID=1945 RepID=UPI0037B8E046